MKLEKAEKAIALVNERNDIKNSLNLHDEKGAAFKIVAHYSGMSIPDEIVDMALDYLVKALKHRLLVIDSLISKL